MGNLKYLTNLDIQLLACINIHETTALNFRFVFLHAKRLWLLIALMHCKYSSYGHRLIHYVSFIYIVCPFVELSPPINWVGATYIVRPSCISLWNPCFQGLNFELVQILIHMINWSRNKCYMWCTCNLTMHQCLQFFLYIKNHWSNKKHKMLQPAIPMLKSKTLNITNLHWEHLGCAGLASRTLQSHSFSCVGIAGK